MSLGRGLATASLVLALAGAHPAGAGERIHTVQAGDSASRLAGRYYGDVHLGTLILEYNGRDETTLHPGEELRIPFAETRTVRPGDVWSVLAQQGLGRASAYPVLAAINGMDPNQPLQVGQRVRLPFLLPHTLTRGETLVGLAEHYYDDDDRIDVLQEINRIEDPRKLSIGQALVIPLLQPELAGKKDAPAAAATSPVEPVAAAKKAAAESKSKPSPEKSATGPDEPPAAPTKVASKPKGKPEPPPAKPATPPDEPAVASTKVASRPKGKPETSPTKPATPPSEPAAAEPANAKPEPGSPPPATTMQEDPPAAPTAKTPPPPRFDEELGAASRAFDDGEYELALDLLESILPQIAAAGSDERRRHHQLLAYVYVAFDRVEDACGILGDADAGPMDPDLVSPKIRTTLSSCGERRH